MATEEGVVSDVSEAFVKQYYQIVETLPQEARKFYIDASVVSRPGPDGTMVSFTSVEAINKYFLSCDSTAFEVLRVDSQYSLENGVLIMVIGFSTGKDNLKRKFSQVFYLALHNRTYVAINDIFRYVDEEAITPITLPVVESVPETEMAKPVVDDASAENSVIASEVKNVVVAGATPPLDNGKITHSAEKAVTAQKPKEPVAETAVPQLDGAKISWAAIVQSTARNTAPFQVKAPVQKTKYMGQQPRAAVAPRAAARAPAAVSKFEKKNDQKIIEEPGTSIFVANLPMDAMPPHLHELFKDFGPIRENGIQVRSSRANGICFGFVAFEFATSVQSVLEAAKNNPFKLGERKLRVKEKQVDYDGSKPSGGRNGGRGNKTQNGSADDGSKPPSGGRSGSGGEGEGEGGSKNGSADDGGDEFKPIRSRRKRRGDRNTNGDNNQKSSEGVAPEVQA